MSGRFEDWSSLDHPEMHEAYAQWQKDAPSLKRTKIASPCAWRLLTVDDFQARSGWGFSAARWTLREIWETSCSVWQAGLIWKFVVCSSACFYGFSMYPTPSPPARELLMVCVATYTYESSIIQSNTKNNNSNK